MEVAPSFAFFQAGPPGGASQVRQLMRDALGSDRVSPGLPALAGGGEAAAGSVEGGALPGPRGD
eukprot:11160359-Lingulodinium_polyedra.AAC.1